MKKARVLNPALYGALVQRYGEVRISNPGQPYLVKQTLDPLRPQGYVNTCVDPGEYYVICCPQCGDSRFRLYVNHRFCTTEGTRLFGRHLIHCFNEGCDLSNFSKLILQPGKYPAASAVLMPTTATEFKKATMPGRCIPIDALPPSHPAVRYITVERKNPAGFPAPFDLSYLHREWGVCYCEEAERNKGYATEFVTGRLIIPIWWDGQLVGWQARAITKDADPKYYTMPGLPKQRILFNGDRARKFPFCVVVEGVFDAFTVGACAVATLGHKLSWTQRELLSKWFGNGAVCLLYDPDAVADIELNLYLMKGMFKGGIFTVPLAKKWDPGCIPTDYLWHLIYGAGKKAGVDVPVMSCKG
jgi:hypothetical protein